MDTHNIYFYLLNAEGTQNAKSNYQGIEKYRFRWLNPGVEDVIFTTTAASMQSSTFKSSILRGAERQQRSL